MGGRKDVNKRTEKQIFWKQPKDVTWELDRSGSRNSWRRNMCATVGLFETTYEGLLKSEF